MNQPKNNVPIEMFPHCDQRVLHAPKECKYCDDYSEWQELRVAWGISFTGHKPSYDGTHYQMSCPSDFNRGFAQAHEWYGNVPTEE